MRAFIGIDFSRKLKNEIAGLQSKLRSYAEAGRWKYMDNFHLTLKFLGEVSPSAINEVCGVMDAACGKAGPFTLNISEMGMFRGKGCIRVLWLGLGGQTDQLLKLQNSTDTMLETLGFEKERRPFTPHITIGQDIIFSNDLQSVKKHFTPESFPVITVDRLNLFKSEQIGSKRVYTSVYERNLG